jgi:hypothetical protein
MMLEDLASRVPSPTILQESGDLATFILNAGRMTYLALHKACTLLAGGKTILRRCRTVF